MIREYLLEREEKNREKEVKSNETSIGEEEESKKKTENAEKFLVGEEDIHEEKAEVDFLMYQADEETGFQQRESSARKQENGESVNETAAGKEDCF